MASQQSSTLNFTTISGGTPITIDGKTYHVRHPESLALASYKDLETKLPRLGHLMVKARLAKPEAEEASQLLAEVTTAILDAPDNVRAKLTDVQRVQIVDLFMKLQPTSLPATPAEAKTRRRPTGGKSSRR